MMDLSFYETGDLPDNFIMEFEVAEDCDSDKTDENDLFFEVEEETPISEEDEEVQFIEFLSVDAFKQKKTLESTVEKPSSIKPSSPKENGTVRNSKDIVTNSNQSTPNTTEHYIPEENLKDIDPNVNQSPKLCVPKSTPKRRIHKENSQSSPAHLRQTIPRASKGTKSVHDPTTSANVKKTKRRASKSLRSEVTPSSLKHSAKRVFKRSRAKESSTDILTNTTQPSKKSKKVTEIVPSTHDSIPKVETKNIISTHEPSTNDSIPKAETKDIISTPEPSTNNSNFKIETKAIISIPGASTSTTCNYFCTYCFFSSPDIALIESHMNLGKHLFQYKCFYCDTPIDFKFKLKSHFEKKHKDTAKVFYEFKKVNLKKECEFVCNVCLEASSSFDEIAIHYSKKHNKTMEPYNYFIQLDKKYKSPTEEIMETSVYEASKAGTKLLDCKYCKDKFQTLELLKEHCIQNHNESKSFCSSSSKQAVPIFKASYSVKYICVLCDKITPTETSIRDHFQFHSSNEPFAFIHLTSETKPILMEVPTYRCSECEIRPDSLANIRKHWDEEHTGKPLKLLGIYPKDTKEFQCPHCKDAFSYKKLQELHINYQHKNEVFVNEEEEKKMEI